ncbi:nitronate monooxygenase [Conexibacter sp. JD483]|uniref:nitronate monooxygenase n=1 Tax=unclassified Conexibacter TaxID=2627773 RepID=UPI0027255F20|nr:MULTISPECIES: nitronate monooxygenase [unclassified Conexibacter]MDO8184629.1 nitronate monooxygenase [Conexibacter sp. CPCC 205706]MDO8197935.1 nitronate monooxygenase [Conexibacter sp. CPCC 205762]MDR9373167.1 nitronate monooxygenase [Conexibacter sp. JD483]
MDRFALTDLDHPIVQAPLAGGPSTPALAAAVSAAGGLGFLATGYKTPEAVGEDVAAVRALTDAPFGVNVFAGGGAPAAASEVERYAGELAGESERLGVALGSPRFDDDQFAAKVELLIEARPAVVSFTFALPPARVVERLHAVGSAVWITVTTPGEARAAVAAGADALVVQGAEAGGHRGTFDDAEPGEIALLPLLQLVTAATASHASVPDGATAEAASGARVTDGAVAPTADGAGVTDGVAALTAGGAGVTDGVAALTAGGAGVTDGAVKSPGLPLVAAGGIANGAGVAAVLAAGAAAAQLGSAFMLTPEAGTSAPHRTALADPAPTALTRAFSGRSARGIVNRFMRDHDAAAPRAYPEIHHLTAPLRAAARANGDADAINLWAGQAHELAEARPAGELVTQLAVDARTALRTAAARFGA